MKQTENQRNAEATWPEREQKWRTVTGPGFLERVTYQPLKQEFGEVGSEAVGYSVP